MLDFSAVQTLSRDILAAGGRAHLVGGFVRDREFNKASKDFDLEVFGLTAEQLKPILETFAEKHGEKVKLVGESFQVFKVGLNLDVSLPRKDRKVGEGHRGFEVVADPHMSTVEASRRRDFTMNAMLLDPLTGQVIDHFGGKQDIEAKLVKMVDPKTFVEDSLRALRAVQFASRFGFEISNDTVLAIENIDLKDLPRERVWMEVEKWLMQSPKPSVGLYMMRDLGILEKLFPELEKLVGVPQAFKHHPEGWSCDTVSSLSNVTGAAPSIPAKGVSVFSPPTFRKILTQAATDSTRRPEAHRALGAVTFKSNDAIGFQSALDARELDIFSTLGFNETSLAKPVSFVSPTFNTTTGTDVSFGVMFKVSKARMLSIMQSSIDDFEVFWSVISPITVNVVDMFKSGEFTTEFKLFDHTMQTNTSALNGRGVEIAVPVVVNSVMVSEKDNDFFVYTVIKTHGKYFNKIPSAMSITEGDVFVHTALAIDVARDNLGGLTYPEQVTVMLATLCHDLGKVETTEIHQDGRITAHGHAEAGVSLARNVLDRLAIHSIEGYDVRAQVLALVENHLAPFEFHRNPPKDSAFRRLATRVDLNLLHKVARADAESRNMNQIGKSFTTEAQDWFLSKISNLAIPLKGPEKLLMGKHLLALGMKPSKQMGEIINKVYEAQLEGEVNSLDEALEMAKLAISEQNLVLGDSNE